MKKTRAEIFGKTQHIWKNRAETEKKNKKEVEKVETEGRQSPKTKEKSQGKKDLQGAALSSALDGPGPRTHLALDWLCALGKITYPLWDLFLGGWRGLWDLSSPTRD